MLRFSQANTGQPVPLRLFTSPSIHPIFLHRLFPHPTASSAVIELWKLWTWKRSVHLKGWEAVRDSEVDTGASDSITKPEAKRGRREGNKKNKARAVIKVNQRRGGIGCGGGQVSVGWCGLYCIHSILGPEPLWKCMRDRGQVNINQSSAVELFNSLCHNRKGRKHRC